jgi:peroxiredoxin
MDMVHPNEERILKVGEAVRDFSLPDTDGTMVNLSAVLSRGPAIVIFYRGDW